MSKYRNNKIGRVSEMFGALSNPNRLKMFLKLVDCCGEEKSCSANAGMGTCIGELAEGLGLAPSTVSHHLKELRLAGLISMIRQGQKVECIINEKALFELSSLLNLQRLESMKR